jgi:urate oxidase
MDARKEAKVSTRDLDTKLLEAKALVKSLQAEKHALVQANKLRKQAKQVWYKETRVEMQTKLRSYGLLAAKGECWRTVRKYTDRAFDALPEKTQTALIALIDAIAPPSAKK